MSRSWEQIIRGSWYKLTHASQVAARVILMVGMLALSTGQFALPAPPRKTGGAAARRAPAKPKVAGAAGLLALAQHSLDAGDLNAAVEYATSAAAKAPVLDDYSHYIRAEAEYRLKNYGEVAKSATHVFEHAPVSPFVGAVAALAVQAELENNSPKTALELIQKYHDQIPQPQADLLLAQSFANTGDLPQAAEYYQRVYYQYPVAKEATDAANALVDIKQRLGDAYPPPMATAMISRAQKLFDARNPAAAKIELSAAVPQLGGADRDLARVRLGVADYLSGHEHDALAYLSALKVDDAEADAERLNYLIRCARKPDRHADVKMYLNQLEQQHAASLWRMDALIFVADEARVDNDAGTYLPLYRACAATFPNERRAAWCHWQVAFDSYRKDSADAYDVLRSHIQQYPDSPDVNNALYFLGRLAERKNDLTSAKACYEELIRRFPNTYYAVVARQRLKDPGIEGSTANPAMAEFLHGVCWPPEPQFPSFTPGEVAATRIERAQLLQTTGLTDFAEGELKFGARTDGEQQNVYAFELAKLAEARNAQDQAMHYIKTYAPGYLYMPL
ncbi:MAG: tetratricopeptide repeat protein, partial [Acidobacteriaceae bacterium]|nr:tetratricopeptide repeat protein [Acidobacteriaceae bacterium]